MTIDRPEMPLEATRPAMRLAIREEGPWWVAYIARHDTMEGAFEIARVAMGAVEEDRDAKAAFMDLCKHITGAALKKTGIGISHWLEPETAPERERSGHA